MDSLHALEQFVEHWRDRPGFLVDPFGNATFRALVKYQSQTSSNSHSTVVRVRRHGQDNGKVRINKEQGLFATFPHVDFMPPWQQYDFDGTDSSLRVVGQSDKLGGQYVVSIRPE